MPERRLAKARASLPEGYQFGDAGRSPAEPRFDSSRKNQPVSAEWMVRYLVDIVQGRNAEA